MVFPTTKTMSAFQNASQIIIENLTVTSSKRSSIEILWSLSGQKPVNFLGYRVHYQKLSSSYIQYGPRLPASEDTYNVNNLVPDTYYKICLSLLRNDTLPNQKCVTAATQSWDLPVSVGSSIGAILALAMIVMLILIIRCRSVIFCKQKPQRKQSKYDTTLCKEGLFDFSQSGMQVDDTKDSHKATSNNERMCLGEREKQCRFSDSGAIPKIKKYSMDDIITHKRNCQCQKRIRNNVRYSDGHLKKRDSLSSDKSETHCRFHDNAIILHANGEWNCDGTSDKNTSNIMMPKTKIDSRKDSQDSECSDIHQSDLLLIFPNADSTSESENEFEMKTLSDISNEGTAPRDIKAHFETCLEDTHDKM